MKKEKKTYLDYARPWEVGKHGLTYSKVVVDDDGYVLCKYFRPCPYDIVETILKGKKIRFWWTGERWDGLNLPENFRPKNWKRLIFENWN